MTEQTAFEEFLADLLWTGAYLKGTRGLESEGDAVLAIRATVKAAIAARNDKGDKLVEAEVAQSIAWEATREPLESLERQTDAYFDKNRKGYDEVFKLTPAAINGTTAPGRAEAIASVVAFAHKPGHEGKLAEAARDFLAAYGHYTRVATARAAAQGEYDQAIKDVAEAKHRGVVVMRTTDGELRKKYAEDPKQVKRFFRTKKASGKKKDKKDETTGDPLSKDKAVKLDKTADKDSGKPAGATAAVTPPPLIATGVPDSVSGVDSPPRPVVDGGAERKR